VFGMNNKVEDKLPVLDGDIFVLGKSVEKNGQVHSTFQLFSILLSQFARFIILPPSQSSSSTVILFRIRQTGTQAWIATTG
jgi:hypothetical protein